MTHTSRSYLAAVNDSLPDRRSTLITLNPLHPEFPDGTWRLEWTGAGPNAGQTVTLTHQPDWLTGEPRALMTWHRPGTFQGEPLLPPDEPGLPSPAEAAALLSDFITHLPLLTGQHQHADVLALLLRAARRVELRNSGVTTELNAPTVITFRNGPRRVTITAEPAAGTQGRPRYALHARVQPTPTSEWSAPLPVLEDSAPLGTLLGAGTDAILGYLLSDTVYFAVDLETLARPATAVIPSFAIRPFTYLAGQSYLLPGRSFATDINDALDHGAVIERDTLTWWLGQSDAARQALIDSQRGAPTEAQTLDDLSAYVTAFSGAFSLNVALGFGSIFDLAKLETAYYRHRKTMPLPFWNLLCGRTLSRSMPRIKLPRDGVHHEPLSDATHMARTLAAQATAEQREHLILPDTPKPT